MGSMPKYAPTLDSRERKSTREEKGVIELDAAFGRMLNLVDGQKVGKERFKITCILMISHRSPSSSTLNPPWRTQLTLNR